MRRGERKLRWTRKNSFLIIVVTVTRPCFLYIHDPRIIYRSQLCDNRDCHWELPTGDAVGEGESGLCHLPCTHSYHWHKVSSQVLLQSLSPPLLPPGRVKYVTYRSYFEAMRWLHKTGRWDRDVSAADRVIPNSMKPHEVALKEHKWSWCCWINEHRSPGDRPKVPATGTCDHSWWPCQGAGRRV